MDRSTFLDVRDGEDNAGTSRFDAATHLYCFQEVSKFYDLSFQSWVKCLFVTTPPLARRYCYPCLGCFSHRLDLEVNAMMEIDSDLKVNCMHSTMKFARKVKNAALLRNEAD